MPLTHRFLKQIRTIHLYLGVFTAPMLLFLALTGGLQSFALHEGRRGSSYVPPAWLVSMAHFHKKQTLVVPRRKPRLAPAVAAPPASGPATTTLPKVAQRDAPATQNLVPMKAYFALVALSLLVSVLSGLYMAWRYMRRPGRFVLVLGAGILVPLLLALL